MRFARKFLTIKKQIHLPHSAQRRYTAILLCAMLLILTLYGCGDSKAHADPEQCPYEEFITIDVFDGLANFQGIQSGWFAKIVRDLSLIHI